MEDDINFRQSRLHREGPLPADAPARLRPASGRLTAAALALFALLVLGACRTETVDTSRIAAQLRNLLQLSTSEYIYHQIGYLGEQRSFLFFTTVDKRLLYSVDVHVLAGVDLSNGFAVVADPTDPHHLSVSLPPATILRIDADERTLHQYFSRSVGGAISRLDYGDQIEKMKSQTRADAIARGILARADENARTIVTNFLQAAGFSTVAFPRPAPASSEATGVTAPGANP